MSATITQDETYREIEVYDPDEELTPEAATIAALGRINEEKLPFDEWEHADCSRINYNKIEVRFQLL